MTDRISRFCLSLNIIEYTFSIQAAAIRAPRLKRTGCKQWEISLRAGTIRSWETKGEGGEGRSLRCRCGKPHETWINTANSSACDFKFVFLQWKTPTHISPLTVFHTHSLTPPPLHLSHEHTSMLIVNPHRHPFSLSHSPSHCISLLPRFCTGIFIPTIQRRSSDAQKHEEKLYVSFVISSDSDTKRRRPRAELRNRRKQANGYNAPFYSVKIVIEKWFEGCYCTDVPRINRYYWLFFSQYAFFSLASI